MSVTSGRAYPTAIAGFFPSGRRTVHGRDKLLSEKPIGQNDQPDDWYQQRSFSIHESLVVRHVRRATRKYTDESTCMDTVDSVGFLIRSSRSESVIFAADID